MIASLACGFDSKGTGKIDGDGETGGTAGSTGSTGPSTTQSSGTSSAATTDASTGPSATTDDPSGSGSGDGTTGAVDLPQSCDDVLVDQPGARSGVFEIDPDGSGTGVEVYCDMDTDGGGWTRFWWWTPGDWPDAVTDVLESPFGACAVNAPYCFGRLPSLPEDGTSLFAHDPQDATKYRWDFDPDNTTAHAAWMAFAEHTEIPSGDARDGDTWAPMELEGSPSPMRNQDSFMYRVEHGVASVLMDDDNCDCFTTLQMGHGMCYGGWGTGSSSEFSYGVDHLFNPGSETGPRPDFALELYYR
jgi:hypothetical protein